MVGSPAAAAEEEEEEKEEECVGVRTFLGVHDGEARRDQRGLIHAEGG